MANRKGNQKRNNIQYMPQKINFRLFIVIVGFIFVYMFIVMLRYLSTNKVTRYEVVEGSLASSTIYRGLILRDEECVEAQNAGYVNYLAREGQRVSAGDLVYTVDETGSLFNYLEANSMVEFSLTDKEVEELKNQIVDYAHIYDATQFNSVYNFKYTLQNAVVKLANRKLLEGISVSETSNPVNYCYSTSSGIIDYWIDGLESLKAEDVTKDHFTESDYTRTNLLSNELHSPGDVLYKLSESEEWSIIISVTPSFGEQLLAENYVKVRFLKNQDESWGKVTLLNNADGGCYAQLTFTNSMITFASDRYLDIELVLSENKGLKIPISSIVEKEFFVVDESFVYEQEGKYYVNKEVLDESGTRTTLNYEVEVYSFDPETRLYYFDDSALNAGDILYMNKDYVKNYDDSVLERDKQNTYMAVEKRGTLLGVYNINKGYADFRQINVNYQNDEYAIVESNSAYGLRIYDYIALNADAVDDDQFISN